MSRRLPSPAPSVAAEMLALVDAARAHAPGAELGWLRGYLMARSLDSSEKRPLRLPDLSEPDFLGSGRFG